LWPLYGAEGRKAAFQAVAANDTIARPILGAPAITGDRPSIIIDGQFFTFAQAGALVSDVNVLRAAVSNVAGFRDSHGYQESEGEVQRILQDEGVVPRSDEPQERPDKPKQKPEKPSQPVWNGAWKSPLNAGVITGRFGEWRGDHSHTGLDIAARTGTPIHASAPGKVIHAGVLGGYGKLVIVRHADNKTTFYGHCSAFKARTGDRVRQGETVALVGSTGHSTGPHVHFEIRVAGKPTNPCKRLKRC
jgi:murein DD-endopeptidase MepM/ murein hydrolase activator NlpD